MRITIAIVALLAGISGSGWAASLLTNAGGWYLAWRLFDVSMASVSSSYERSRPRV